MPASAAVGRGIAPPDLPASVSRVRESSVFLRLLTGIGAASALLCSCRDSATTQALGSADPVVFQLWDAADVAPTVILADRVHQQGLSFDTINLDRVTIRRPVPDGVACVQAPSATYRRRAEDAITLSGPPDQVRPIRLSGQLRGVPFAGVARAAVLKSAERVLRLTDVVIQYAGKTTIVPVVDVTERDQILGHGGNGSFHVSAISRPDRQEPSRYQPAPAVAAMLAALPRPATVPEIDVKR